MASSHLDPYAPDRSTEGTPREIAGARSEDDPMSEAALVPFIREATRHSREYKRTVSDRGVRQSQRAWRNQHFEGSKYTSAAFRNRSQLFVPKTRAAVRKNLTAAAAALHSSDSAAKISAQFEDDPLQLATADVIGKILEYRMSRTAGVSGIPWFLISMGGCLDGQLTGVTVSKQDWDFQEVETDDVEPVVAQDAEGNILEFERNVRRVVVDRPTIDLVPYEHAYPDPAAPWWNPVQGGAYWIVMWPMTIRDYRLMVDKSAKRGGAIKWIDLDDNELAMGRKESRDSDNTARARERGGDRYEDSHAASDLDIIWLQENFVRIDGEDYCFWTVGTHLLASEPIPTYKAYPQYNGERPYVMGVSTIESHMVLPMSPVESWQPLQFELNDITNLRLDVLKRSIAPLAKVKRGRKVDLKSVQERGDPNTIIMLDDPANDVVLEPTPGPSGASYTESANVNASFDELSGTFSTTSVQTNRQLNDTVGGMKMMGAAGNSVTEFDIKVWTETWVEPVLRQVVHSIKYFENDERILRIAGAKAAALKQYDIMPSLSDFDECELIVRVAVQDGSSDPMQRQARLQTVMGMLMPSYEAMASEGYRLNWGELLNEGFASAGFRDGQRFWTYQEPQPQPDPDTQVKMAQIEADREGKQLDNQTKMEIAKLDARVKLGMHIDDMQVESAKMQQGDQQFQQQAIASEQSEKRNFMRDAVASQQKAARPAGNGSGPRQNGGGNDSIIGDSIAELARQTKETQAGMEIMAKALVSFAGQMKRSVDEMVQAQVAPKDIIYNDRGEPVRVSPRFNRSRGR